MSTLTDLFGFLGQLVGLLWQGGRGEFFIAVLVGLVLGAGAWWLARAVALRYNRQFAFTPQYHAYCALAAVLTLVFALLFVAMQYTGPAARAVVAAWELSLSRDGQWSSDTFRAAYEAVYDLHDAKGVQIEDFTGHPHPSTGLPTVIPATSVRAQETAAEVYARSAVDNFRERHPLLSKLLWPRSSAARAEIYTDMQRFFESRPRGVSYDADDAIRLAGREIRRQLDEQAPRVVLFSRVALVVLFLLVQGLAFALLIRSALADIKETPVPRFQGR